MHRLTAVAATMLLLEMSNKKQKVLDERFDAMDVEHIGQAKHITHG
jgi:hypothetical protein